MMFNLLLVLAIVVIALLTLKIVMTKFNEVIQKYRTSVPEGKNVTVLSNANVISAVERARAKKQISVEDAQSIVEKYKGHGVTYYGTDIYGAIDGATMENVSADKVSDDFLEWAVATGGVGRATISPITA